VANDNQRVVVTGMGAINGQGTNLDEYWEGVRAGRVAIREVQHLPMDGYRTKIGGEVQAEPQYEREYLNPDGFHDRAIDFTMRAAEEAMDRCGVGVGAVPAERWGVVIGTCNAGLLAGEEWYRQRKEGKDPDPKLLLLVEPQAMSEAVSGAFGIKGPVLSVDTACAASANAIGYGAELIRLGHVDAVLAGGADAFSDILIAGFNSLESLSPEPAAPYSIDRQGLSLGEGAGMLVLMREDVAKEQGATILAEVAGYGLSADGYHPTAPHPEGKGAARAIKTGLRMAGISPDQVDYVNSHGTGTAKNDTAETAATKAGLGEDAARKVAVSSTKSMIGHLLGGAGAVEAIVTVQALQNQVAPPTANFTEPDPECDLDYVPNEAREMKIQVAVSNNFAFGGANASVTFLHPDVRDEPPPAVDVDRVAITGIGALTTAGTDLDSLWEAYSSDRDTTTSENGARVGRVDFTPGDFLGPKERKRVDRLGLFSIISTKLALDDAGVTVDDDNRERIGVILGTGVGPMESMEQFAAGVIEEGASGANPAVFPNTVYNAAGGQVAIKVGLIGSATTVTAGHAAGACSLTYGFDLTSRDHADAIICLGADALTDTVLEGYRQLGVLGADGLALAEAGVALLVERMGKAQERGARIYGEVLGYGVTSDARGVGRIDPEGQGIERAMRIALERAGVEPGQVAAVWTAKTGLAPADAAEDAAIDRLFGGDVPRMAPKLKLGEPMGAGPSLSAALAMKGWQEGDEEKSPKGPVVVNATSLGGTNFSVVLAPVS
jgi:3-oxoacyl-[acyl-carrier-protein] synthase II